MNPGLIYRECHPKKVKNYSILTGVTPGYPRIKPCSFTDLDTWVPTFPQALSAAATLQTPCQAALIAAYVHHSHWALGRNHGPLASLAVETHRRMPFQCGMTPFSWHFRGPEVLKNGAYG